MSSVENPGWLFDIGDEILPSYIGIIISHYKDPYQPTRIQWNVNRMGVSKNRGKPPKMDGENNGKPYENV